MGLVTLSALSLSAAACVVDESDAEIFLIAGVNVFDDVKWTKAKENYKINIVFTNSGERIAK